MPDPEPARSRRWCRCTHGAAGRGDELPVPGGQVRQRGRRGGTAWGEKGREKAALRHSAGGAEAGPVLPAVTIPALPHQPENGGRPKSRPRPRPAAATEHRERPRRGARSCPPSPFVLPLPPRWRPALPVPAATCHPRPPWPLRRRPPPLTVPTWLRRAPGGALPSGAGGRVTSRCRAGRAGHRGAVAAGRVACSLPSLQPRGLLLALPGPRCSRPEGPCRAV